VREDGTSVNPVLHGKYRVYCTLWPIRKVVITAAFHFKFLRLIVKNWKVTLSRVMKCCKANANRVSTLAVRTFHTVESIPGGQESGIQEVNICDGMLRAVCSILFQFCSVKSLIS